MVSRESLYSGLGSLVDHCVKYLTYHGHEYYRHLLLAFFMKHVLEIKEADILIDLNLYSGYYVGTS